MGYFRKGSGHAEAKNRKSIDKQHSINGNNVDNTTEAQQEKTCPVKDDSVNGKNGDTENTIEKESVAKVPEKPEPHKVPFYILMKNNFIESN